MRRLHKLHILLIVHLATIDPERSQQNLVSGCFIAIPLIDAHREFSGGDQDHFRLVFPHPPYLGRREFERILPLGLGKGQGRPRKETSRLKFHSGCAISCRNRQADNPKAEQLQAD
jgi:hypothetical protein